ncbi:unnamed protein product [Auanema sp. JU1783]|nr:unnamed protein product [Auanema sp. JU1783]
MVVKLTLDEVLKKETFLFDADGVLWTGDKPIAGAVEFISSLLAQGKRVFILTNNSTKTIDHYMKKLERLGFPELPKENVISPAIVISAYLAENKEYENREVYLLGTDSLRSIIESESTVKCIGTGPDAITDYTDEDILHHLDLHANPKAVICSFDSHFSYPKVMKAANYLNRPEVQFLITNEDYTFPGPDPNIVIPGSGTTSACIRAVTNKEPIVFGKPHKALADFLKRRHHIDSASTIMFGDRLDTDIAFANNNDIDSVLVLTGIHSLADAKNAEESGKANLAFDFCRSEETWGINRTTKSSGVVQQNLGKTGQQMDPSGWQKQSHSSLLSTSEAIYEISTHNYKPGERENYLQRFGNLKVELSEKIPSVELVGSWTVNYGRTRDQAIHLWRYRKGYTDVDSIVKVSGSDAGIMAADNDVGKLCGRRKSILVKSFSYWREPEQRPASHVYDMRSYCLQPGSMIEWANAWAKGITFRREQNQDVGGFFAQIGQLYVVYHFWAYPSMSARHDTRTQTWAKPGWDATVAYTVPLIKKMQSKILTPTKYSQLQ